MSLAELMERAVGGGGPVRFTAYDGSAAGAPDAETTVELRSPLAIRYVASSPGDLGLARAYISGHLEVHGDLYTALVDLSEARFGNLTWAQRKEFVQAAGGWTKAMRAPEPPPEEHHRPRGLRRHSKSRDAEVIQHHYDVSNLFYSWVLGPSMAYTCAVYPKPEASLEEAQAEKFDLVARKLGLHQKSGQRVLDVGCGWGGFAMHAAREYGARVVAVTLSKQQAEYGQQAVVNAGLGDLVDLRYSDYRDVTEDGFDAVASIGLTEHIGEKNLSSYVSFLASKVKPHGLFLNHCITRAFTYEGARAKGFIDSYVFPDGELESVSRIIGEIQDNGFEVVHEENLREHYAMTLRDWSANLEAHWDEAVAEVGIGRARVWRLYMAGSRLGFSTRRIELHQVLGVKTAADGASGLPLRPWW